MNLELYIFSKNESVVIIENPAVMKRAKSRDEILSAIFVLEAVNDTKTARHTEKKIGTDWTE